MNPIDPDFPFLGGKTLKAAAGLELAAGIDNVPFRNGSLVVKLKE
ncbi:hypothetical protein [Thiocapsa sp.]|nr:hypothetical protein [Thiocapsa sp.]